VEVESGDVLYEQGAERRIPPASLAKLMTVLLAVEAVEGGLASMLDVVTVSRHAASMGGSQVWLGAGERYTLGQLLESVMIASANDSAVAVAEHLAGSERQFVGLMTKRASELGMCSTRFVNATGLPAGEGEHDGYTTASDMARLAREALGHQVILEWSSTRSKAFRNHPLFIMSNTNPLLGMYPGCDGLKTGHTKAAGYHLIATARADGVRLVAVIMHADNEEARATGCARLLDYGFAALRAGATARSTTETGVRKPGVRDPGVR
jgi:D-alanyl-D-alanine carboxypeptidase (penicillin-binding protein 5/6)